MKITKRIFSILMAVSMLIGLIPSNTNFHSSALTNNIKLSPGIFEPSAIGGDMSVTWDKNVQQTYIKAKYHSSEDDSLVEEIYSTTNNFYKVIGIKNDFIYDITIEIYNQVDTLLGSGTIFFLPKTTISYEAMSQTRKALDGGGFEIGNAPVVKLTYKTPKVWIPSTGKYEYASTDEAISYIKSQINTNNDPSKEITKLDFKINISDSFGSVPTNPIYSTIMIESGDNGYSASPVGSSVTAQVYEGTRGEGENTFYLVGRKTTSDVMPTGTQIGLETDDIPQTTNYLQYPELVSGKVYFLGIKTMFRTPNNADVYVCRTGTTENKNVSYLNENNGYLSTPLRFTVTKDSADNVYITMFQLDTGGLDIGDMSYEVQMGDDKSVLGDWEIKKKTDMTYFNSVTKEALVILADIGPNNIYYYKIVVKAGDEAFRAESMPLGYSLNEDVTKPPVPKGILVAERKLTTREAEVNGVTVIQKATDIVLSWDKPASWQIIKENLTPDDDIVYHFMLSTSQKDLNIQPNPPLIAEGQLYGYFQSKYRKIKYISARDPNIIENGTKLQYTIKGFELFDKCSYMSDYDLLDNKAVITGTSLIESNTENYPTLLLPNKVYFLQMYTTKNINRETQDPHEKSEMSAIVSFTSIGGGNYDAPLPKTFRTVKNDVDYMSEGDQLIPFNYVEMQFDKVEINWQYYLSDISVAKSVYYDIYIGTKADPDTFVLLGTTQNPSHNIIFTGHDVIQEDTIKARIDLFKEGTEAYELLGSALKPNTRYNVMARTRLKIQGNNIDRVSKFTSVVPITTKILTLPPPDDDLKLPKAPLDFEIDKDSQGNSLVTSTSVKFKWTKNQDNAKYQMICSSFQMTGTTSTDTVENDPIYSKFFSEKGNLLFDLGVETKQGLEYVAEQFKAKYFIESGLIPNKLYYFSIRAIDKTDNSKVSTWVSIPVTTKLIEAPTQFETVTQIEIGVSFIDTTANTTKDDYVVYAKKTSETDYRIMQPYECSVVKYNTKYFVRIKRLVPNTLYDLKVLRGRVAGVTVFEKTNIKTIDTSHEIEIMWKGVLDYSYEIALRKINEVNPVILKSSDCEQYQDLSGTVRPYFAEKTDTTLNSQYYLFHAKIKTYEVTMGDIKKSIELISNTKYFVKVRAVNRNPIKPDDVSYSKFTSSVEVRTEFNDEDNIKAEEQRSRIEMLTQRVTDLSQKVYFNVSIGNGKSNKIYITSEKLSDILKNTEESKYSLDFTTFTKDLASEVVYIPQAVFETINSKTLSLEFNDSVAKVALRANSIMPDNAKILYPSTLKQTIIKLELKKSASLEKTTSTEFTPVSKNFSIEAKWLGYSNTSADFEKLIYDKIFNTKDGLLLDQIERIRYQNETDIDAMVKTVETDLSNYLSTILESTGQGIFLGAKNITEFKIPINIDISYSGKTSFNAFPWGKFNGSNSYVKITQNILSSKNKCSFDIIAPGQFVLATKKELVAQDKTSDLSQSEIAEKTVIRKYDIDELLKKSEIDMNEVINVGDSMAIAEKIIYGKSDKNTSLASKIASLNLRGLITPKDSSKGLLRQELAVLGIKIFSEKTGTTPDLLRPKALIYIGDELSISKQCYVYVANMLDLGLMSLDDNINFNPKDEIIFKDILDVIEKIDLLIEEQ